MPATILAVMAAAQTGGTGLKRFVISDFGAVADARTVNTKAIQAAIDKCAASGGGVVVVPKGTFLSGAIFLKQGVNLNVEKDGVLKGTTNIDDYPMIATRWEGTEEPWTSAFVNAEGMTDLEISGEGTIDGSGEEWMQNNPFRGPAGRGGPGGRGNAAAGAAPAAAVRSASAAPGAGGAAASAADREAAGEGAAAGAAAGGGAGAAPAAAARSASAVAGAGGAAASAAVREAAGAAPAAAARAASAVAGDGVGAAPAVAGAAAGGGPGTAPARPPGPRRGRPRLVGIQNSKRVHVAGLNLHNQAVWCLFVLYSEDVLAENLRITAEHNIPSSDGIDIDSSKRVRIDNVYIDVNDDCISIKSGKDADGLRVNRPAEDIIVENSHFAYGHGGVAMGSETSGGIRNVEVRNCVSDSGNWAPIRFKTQPSRSGVVENITYRNITLHETRQAFEFNLEWRMVPPIAPPAQVLPVVRNVKIINVSGDVQSVGIIHGLAGSPIRDIRFENCKITAQKGFRLEHARNVDLAGLQLDVKDGEPVTKNDVQ
jgi:polygalacturonase